MTFGCDENPVLRDFSLTIKAGEHVTLVGRSGVGKTPFSNSYEPKEGQVIDGGINTFTLSDRMRRKSIGCSL
ncbi:MAG: ATP-binding cassette domain-containing protein [Sutterella sp.]|nr:ATP-binding cassette domain-containing protein [Sutterella sp.]MDY3273435.1 ATP-binding cassette domain-containing protein [Duodenibacillus sp.]